MCGITGVFKKDRSDVSESVVSSMTNTLEHRGPDAGNLYTYKHVGLGHRRLSIIDLSINGNQPMSTKNGRFSIVYNGEVYNYLEIKNTLLELGYHFNSSSDAEVILNAFEKYGTKTFDMLNGMFAIAIYDRKEDLLYLARDPFGIKPLYYYSDERVFLFGSEIKAIKSYNDTSLTIDPQALTEYLWYGNPLGERTFYNEVRELSPGSFMTVGDECKVEKYFEINSVTECNLSEEAIVARIRTSLEDSVKRHLIGDVPVGVFLSGGVDSSAIVAYASKHYKSKLRTYSVGFDYDKGISELPLASEIASLYKTEHTEVHISGENIINVIENLVTAHDEPFGDAADIPLYLLTKKLKNEIKVVLQGDGGDEFFGGYSRYKSINNVRLWSKLRFMLPIISLFKPQNSRILRFQRFISAIAQKEPWKRNALLLTMESEYSNPMQVLSAKFGERFKNCDPFKRYKEVYDNYSERMDHTQALFYTDAQIILKDTFFEKVDKATMANSMEIRVPFVDKALTHFLLSVPGTMKVKNGKQKYLLKKALEGLVPDKILYGPKKGFGVPYGYWLQTSLKDYFIETISDNTVSEFLDKDVVMKLFNLHLKGKGNYEFLLWKVLILAVWIKKFGIQAE